MLLWPTTQCGRGPHSGRLIAIPTVQRKLVLRPARLDPGRSFFPRPDAAQGVGGFDVARAHGHRHPRRLPWRKVAQQCSQEPGDRAIARAVRADDLRP